MSRPNMVGRHMNSECQSASTDLLLRTVADPERRAILRHLHATDSRAVGIDELAEELEAREHPPGSEGSRAMIELRHSHLPMLADANAIEYDRGRDFVAYCGDDRIEDLLSFVSERLESVILPAGVSGEPDSRLGSLLG